MQILNTEDNPPILCHLLQTIDAGGTHESVAIVPERSISGHALTRILDRLAVQRGLPQAIRADNGKEFCRRAILTWAHTRGVKLFMTAMLANIVIACRVSARRMNPPESSGGSHGSHRRLVVQQDRRHA